LIFFCELFVIAYIVTQIINYTNEYTRIFAQTYEEDDLYRFFALMNKLNGGKNYDKELVRRFEDFFDTFWQNYDAAMQEEFLTDLPLEIQNKILFEFVYKTYFEKFNRYFQFKKATINKVAYYNMRDR